MHKTTLKVLIGTLSLTILIFIVSFFYYGSVNSSEDPRVMPARALLQKFDKQLEEHEGGLALALLDEALRIYESTPGYEDSYERGVIINDKATVYLVQLETQILNEEDVNKEHMLQDLETAKKYTLEAIGIYEKWIAENSSLSEQEIRKKLKPFYKPDDPAFSEVGAEAVLENRVEDYKVAQIETKRRLSVSLTNLGFINRYKGNLEEAKKNYETAINLWDRNYTAQDNLNMLMNRPVKKRSLIDKLFPPEKDKEADKKNS